LPKPENHQKPAIDLTTCLYENKGYIAQKDNPATSSFNIPIAWVQSKQIDLNLWFIYSPNKIIEIYVLDILSRGCTVLVIARLCVCVGK